MEGSPRDVEQLQVGTQQISDLYWLAVDIIDNEWSRGVAAAAGWLLGTHSAPLTERQGSSTAKSRRYELWAARHVIRPDLVDLAYIAADAGVQELPPVCADRDYATGVQFTLEWAMTGQHCPLTLPRRKRSGAPFTEDDFYQEKKAAMGAAFTLESRWTLQDQARVLAARTHQLVTQILRAQQAVGHVTRTSSSASTG